MPRKPSVPARREAARAVAAFDLGQHYDKEDCVVDEHCGVIAVKDGSPARGEEPDGYWVSVRFWVYASDVDRHIEDGKRGTK